MSLVNNTRWAALDVPYQDHEGRDVVIGIVKATFDLLPGGRTVPAEVPAAIRLNDKCHVPDEPRSSLAAFSDVCVEKRGTDVVVHGDAVSSKLVASMDVAVQVRDRTVPVRVHGERVFYRGVRGMSIGRAAPFDRMPIVYERAYGGASDDYMVADLRNPAGVGVAKDEGDLDGRRAPQIEHPARPHISASDDHAPVGFAAIMTYWTPRREFAGTMDDVWLATRMPLLPRDFDVRFNNVAHPDLRIEDGLRAGDRVGVVGMTHDDPIVFDVPALDVCITGRFDDTKSQVVVPNIDTVFVRPGDRQVEIVGRATFPMGRCDLLREIVVEDLRSSAG